jgi:methyl-accepting chemotaxis protein
MQSRMTLGRKLTLCFAAFIGLVLVLSFAFLNSVNSLSTVFETAVGKTAKKIRLAGDIDASESDMLAWQRGLFMHSFMKNNSGAEAAKQEFRAAYEKAFKSLNEIVPLLVDDEGRRIVSGAKSGLESWKKDFEELERLCAAGDPAAAVVYGTSHIVPVYETIAKDMDRLTELQANRLAADRDDAAGEKTRSRWIAFALIGLSILVGVIVLMTVRSVNAVLRQVATGMASGAGQVAGAASQVAGSSQSLAQAASQQAASIEETSAATEEIFSMARKNTENAQSAADLVASSQAKFQQTEGSLQEMVSAMGDITNSSGKISKIIKVIDEIAFQTNILALNAAVEAARAGESGLGFAVVADEVRNLAQRCAQAASDTSVLIEESVTKSSAGQVKVDMVARAIHEVAEEAAKIKVLVDEISMGSKEQTRGLEQISTAVTQMDKATQKSAANAEEGASAATEMTAQSETLKDIVGQLTVLVNGTR